MFLKQGINLFLFLLGNTCEGSDRQLLLQMSDRISVIINYCRFELIVTSPIAKNRKLTFQVVKRSMLRLNKRAIFSSCYLNDAAI